MALCFAVFVAAQVAVPELVSRVTDSTGTLNAEQKANLEQTLKDFETRKGSQIGVLIVSTTSPEAIEQYSLRVVERWKLGRKKVDDGALLIIAKDDRTLRIEVGYGFEGVLNDAICQRIISEVITPKLKQADFYGGITDGVNRMIRVAEGEPLPPVREQANNEIEIKPYIPLIFILALVVGGALRAIFGRLPGAIVTGGVMGFLAWLFAGAISIALLSGLLAFVFALLGGGVGKFIGGQHGGFSGGGGFGGGGGSFGGGGASGRW
ncbi:MAG: TPM domain-containing protein [Undibacterium sp.]|nr:TPM domain-containing protein [Undibacterium sp.]